MDLSERVTRIIEHFGLNDSRLGKIAGLSGTSIANIKDGSVKSPRIDFAINIANELKVSPNWLLLGVGEMLLNSEPNKLLTDDPSEEYSPKTLSDDDRLTAVEREIEELAVLVREISSVVKSEK